MSKDFDIEDLKVHRIEPLRDGKQRVHLPVAGSPPPGPADAVDEAFGGNDERKTIAQPEEVHEEVLEVLKSIYDPEIPLNVYDLGLIYGVEVQDDGDVEIKMTLTAPACPVAGQIVKDVATKVGAIDTVRKAHVKLVWDPPWTKERMSDDALLELGLL